LGDGFRQLGNFRFQAENQLERETHFEAPEKWGFSSSVLGLRKKIPPHLGCGKIKFRSIAFLAFFDQTKKSSFSALWVRKITSFYRFFLF